MRVALSGEFAGDPEARAAAAILRRCVHCGFCNATCPTYRLLGDELDGPRGRAYLIKGMLEGGEVTRRTQMHLDRCLTCLNCTSTCPSGVEFGPLLEIGRRLVDARVPRSPRDRLRRALLRAGLTSRWFATAVSVARRLRPWLPRRWRDRLPVAPAAPARAAAVRAVAELGAGTRHVLLLAGCVQPSLLPNVDRATRRVLAAAGVETRFAAGAGCCGALREHLSDPGGARAAMRRNVDAWWPALAAGEVEAIVVNASACALSVKN
ncbi:MAG TPA: glycolate oxidase subunit GlcF, partial [Steroidobacteraceae bacterium]|nr:glycolate oxidase subunit GlcF [Steroidobacteraceae bacterium]